MSVQAIGWVLDHSKSRLAARHVLISIANHAKSDGTGAWPSVSTIARESRISKREVQRSIPQLVALGELHVEAGAGPNGTHMYSLPKMMAGRQAVEGVTNCHRGVTSCHGGGVTNGRIPPDQKSPEPSLEATVLREEKKKPAPKTGALRFPLPEWLPLDAWDKYMKLRKRKRASVDDDAAELLVSDLGKWRNEGQDVRAILEASVKNGWTGIFQVKGGTGNGNNHVRASNIETTLRGYEQLQAGAHR